MEKFASLTIQIGKDYRPLFHRGLERLGYTVLDKPVENPGAADVLVLWNRLPITDQVARRYEEAGAKVVIAENGWIGSGTYALCLGNHNGAGKWNVGWESRWPGFGIPVQPWRKQGRKVLVVPQRGMGVPPAAMPRPWGDEVVARLKQVTDRPIEVRKPQDRIHPFEQCLNDCHAVVTWASGAGVKAIVAGVPVFYEMEKWIGRLAARPGIQNIEEPYLGERETMLHRLSWAMWKADEVESGEAFTTLLRD